MTIAPIERSAERPSPGRPFEELREPARLGRQPLPPLEAMPETETLPLDEEITLKTSARQLEVQAADTTTIPKRKWWQVVRGVQERYQKAKQSLVLRTEQTLSRAADEYIERYERERDPVTGEVPSSFLRRCVRGMEALRASVTLQSGFELTARAALAPLEFAGQMAMRQFGIDLAVRQAEYQEVEERYGGKDAVAAVEQQALEFAQHVKQHFEQLSAQVEKLSGEKPAEREQFRQQKITAGMQQAEQLLANVHVSDPAAKQRILQDLRTYLDTVMYDPQRSTVLRRWDQLGRGYRGAIQDLVAKHIDIYQKRKARNVAAVMTTTRWLTFGLESYVVQRVLAAHHSVTANYDKLLTQLPAEQRGTVERLKLFARSVGESLTQVAGLDQYRAVREQGSQIDALVASLMPDAAAEVSAQAVDVDHITQTLYQKFQSQLAAKGLTEQWLYDQVEGIAFQQRQRRTRLADLLKYRLNDLHRQYTKTAARQAEHVYNQYNINVTALSILADIDMTVERATHIRERIGTVLEQSTQAVAAIESELLENHSAESLVQAVTAERDHLAMASAADTMLRTDNFPQFQEDEEVSADNMSHAPIVADVQYTVQAHDSTWAIAERNLTAYQEREHNPNLTISQAVALIARDNHLADAAAIRAGMPLTIAAYASAIIESDQALPSPEMTTAEIEHDVAPLDVAAMKQLAKAVDAGEAIPEFVVGAHRENLADLPPSEYQLVFGERIGHGKHSIQMPVRYTEAYVLTVGADHTAPMVGKIPLSDFLLQERAPIVRVFHTGAESIEMKEMHLQPAQWSQRTHALVQYLQEHPIRVVEQSGTYCAKDMAGRLDLFSENLAADVGAGIRNHAGAETGVTAHAPVLAAAIESVGGTAVASLNDDYFTITASGAIPTMTLETPDADYRARVTHWVHEAAQSPLRLATFLYSGTHIQNIIAANREHGGEANSHVVTLLGERDLTAQATTYQTVADVLQQAWHISAHDLEQRGWLFQALGIAVNGQEITTEANWQNLALAAGDRVVVHDVALNHRFDGDRADTLVRLMVDTGQFTPVSILEPNAAVVNDALAYDAESPNYFIDTFQQVAAGDTMAKILERAHVPRDVWMAHVMVMRAAGQNPDVIQPGQLIAIYNESELRENLNTIYTVEERRLATVNADEAYYHIIRPGEAMDDIVAQFYERGRYAPAEWHYLREQLADMFEIERTQRDMPGDEYTVPYQTTEYHLPADKITSVTHEQLAQLDEAITERRLAERIYVPDHLPIHTPAGTVEQPLPEQMRTLVDTVIDHNPNYGEDLRVALTMVYANEAMRETADKTLVSRSLEWVDQHVAQPSWQALEWFGARPASDKEGWQYDYRSAYSSVIHSIEYLASRQMQKDVAWWIHDSPHAHGALEYAIQALQADLPHHPLAYQPMNMIDLTMVSDWYNDAAMKVSEKLQTIEGISSAGLFQVRANNFVSEDDQFNMTGQLAGRVMEHDQFEQALRDNPLLNTEAAAALLHQNEQAIDTYLAAFGDPARDNSADRILAIVASYNGGPDKIVTGGIQYHVLEMERALGIETPLEQATGRDAETTRQAFQMLCYQLADEGRLAVSREQIDHDIALLGRHTIGFLRSATLQQFKGAYADMIGEPMSLLPTMDRLALPHVSYANYAYLANRGEALTRILEHSHRTKIALGHAIIQGYSRSDAPFETANQG